MSWHPIKAHDRPCLLTIRIEITVTATGSVPIAQTFAGLEIVTDGVRQQDCIDFP
jgi:hypothetical protein